MLHKQKTVLLGKLPNVFIIKKLANGLSGFTFSKILPSLAFFSAFAPEEAVSTSSREDGGGDVSVEAVVLDHSLRGRDRDRHCHRDCNLVASMSSCLGY